MRCIVHTAYTQKSFNTNVDSTAYTNNAIEFIKLYTRKIEALLDRIFCTNYLIRVLSFFSFIFFFSCISYNCYRLLQRLIVSIKLIGGYV